MKREVAEFEALFMPHLDAAYNLARWLVGRDDEAQDVVQEAYTRALKKFGQFRGDNPRGWLLSIVRNTAYTSLKRRATTDKNVLFDEELHTVPNEPPTSEVALERRRQRLGAAIGRLPTEFREVLVLHELEGWSYKAIAHALKVPLGTIMSRLSRARRKLRAEFEAGGSGESEDEL
jgi:RNA polymerase sigma-70 factor, ECF subfamily